MKNLPMYLKRSNEADYKTVTNNFSARTMAAQFDPARTKEEVAPLNSDIEMEPNRNSRVSSYAHELDEGKGYSNTDVINAQNTMLTLSTHKRNHRIFACISISSLIISLFSVISVIYLFMNQNQCQNINTPITTQSTSTYVIDNATTSIPTNNPSQSPTIQPSPSPTKSPIYTYLNYVGDYKISAQNTSHDNWLLCDGSFIDPNDYKQLFNVIGYSFGSQISGTVKEFALPNAMDHVVGINGDDNIIGDKIGQQSMNLDTDHIPKHSHLTIHNGQCSNTHGFSESQPYLVAGCGFMKDTVYAYSLQTTSSAPDAVRTSDVGEGKSFQLYQPTVFVGNLFIYAGH